MNFADEENLDDSSFNSEPDESTDDEAEVVSDLDENSPEKDQNIDADH